MALNLGKIKGNTGNFVEQEPLEAGAYPARLVQVLDLGVQPQDPYQGKEKPPKNEIQLTYELLDEFVVGEDGEEQLDKPRWLSETLPVNPLDSDLAKSTKRYLVFDPEIADGGDFVAQLGKPVMVTIVQNPGKGKNAGKVYNNIAGISAMRPKEAAKAPDLVNPSKAFDLEDPDLEVFNSLPQWIQDKIKSNLEFAGSPLAGLLGEQPNEEEEDEDW